MDKKNIKLHQACILKRLKLKDVARLAGIKTYRFSKVLNGRLEATIEERRALSKILGKPQKDLF